MINSPPAKNTRRLKITFVWLGFVCLVSSLSYSFAAQTSKPELAQKIHIVADHMKMNIESEKSIYTGHVRLSQGGRILTGDTVTIMQNKNQIEQITVNGNPATYTHTTKPNETINASSRKMVYTDSNHLLVLTGDAQLSQPEHTVSSQKIVYDMLRHTIVAGNPAAGNPAPGNHDVTAIPANERVKITLTPQESSTKKMP